MRGGLSSTMGIAFGESADNDIGLIEYNTNTDIMSFTAGAVNSFNISATGVAVVGDITAATMQSGTTQGGAGASAGEMWVDTDDDNTVKLGV